MRLLWLAEVLKDAGLKVLEEPGWRARGGEIGNIQGILCHHTAGPKNGNMPSLKTVKDGRPRLRGPLAQLLLARDGSYVIVASGKANHAGKGKWPGITSGNSHLIGIEAENTGLANDPWPTVQLAAYVRGVAAILEHLGLPYDKVIGHKEWAPTRKIDPTFNMNDFRERVKEDMARKKKNVFDDIADWAKGKHEDEEEPVVLTDVVEEKPIVLPAPGTPADKVVTPPEVKAGFEPWIEPTKEVKEPVKKSVPSRGPDAAVALLEQLGWLDYQAAALIAQAVVETNMDPNAATYAINKKITTKENPNTELYTFGILNWDKPRTANLDRFVTWWNSENKTNLKRSDEEAQVRFIDWDLRNVEKPAFSQLKSSTNVTEAVRAALAYLRPNKWSVDTPENSDRWPDRVSAAFALLDK